MTPLTAEQLDTLQEFMNIGVGRAASLLNEMVEHRILLSIPSVQITTLSELQQTLKERFPGESYSAVRLGFSGGFAGSTELVFPTESASTLVSVLTGEDPDSPDLDAVKIGTLSEIGNILLNGVMGSMSNLLNQRIHYAIPIYLEDSIQNLLLRDRELSNETIFLLAQTRFAIEHLEIIGDIILIFEVNSFSALLQAIDQELGVPSQ